MKYREFGKCASTNPIDLNATQIGLEHFDGYFQCVTEKSFQIIDSDGTAEALASSLWKSVFSQITLIETAMIKVWLTIDDAHMLNY